MWKYLKIIMLFGLLSSCCESQSATNFDQQLKSQGFMPEKLNPKGSYTFKSKNDYFVSKTKGVLTVLTDRPSRPFERECDAEITWHGIHYCGESERGLDNSITITNPDGRKKSLITDEFAQQFLAFPDADELLVLSGYLHTGISHGALFRVRMKNAEPVAEKLTLLPDYPLIMAAPDEGALLIFGRGGLTLLLSTSIPGWEQMMVLLKDDFWVGFHPNSVVLYRTERTASNNTIDRFVIGGNGGVITATVDLGGVHDLTYYKKIGDK